MPNLFTLDSLREELEREFAPVVLELENDVQVTLQNILRLKKSARTAVLDALKALRDIDSNSEDESEVDKLVELSTTVLKQIADKPGALLKALDGEVGLLMKVIAKWLEATQPGEAKPSPSS